MASVIKKGAKGKEVEKIQTLLNKVNAKPKLTVDGDFGANTEKAVIDFQKRCKLKTDGIVGVNTKAALVAGGPIPKMPIKDQTNVLKAIELLNQNNTGLMQDYAVMSSAASSLGSKMDKKMPAAMKLSKENDKLMSQLLASIKLMIKKQAEFEKIKMSDPKKAEAIAADLLKMDAANDVIRKNGSQKMAELAGVLEDMKKSLVSNTSALTNIMAGIKKRSERIDKELAKLG